MSEMTQRIYENYSGSRSIRLSVQLSSSQEKFYLIRQRTLISKCSQNMSEFMTDLFDSYEDSIANIDFRLDTQKVKRDIKKRTEIFMKKRK